MGTAPLLFRSHVDVRPWIVHLYWAEIDGRPECVGVSIFGGGEPENAEELRVTGFGLRAVTSEAWRGIRFAELIEQERKKLKKAFSYANAKGFESSVWNDEDGRYDVRGWPPGHLRDVAAVYLAASSRNPTKAVEEHFGVTRSAAAKWVAKCRAPEVGLLAPTTQGRSSGGVTKKRARR